MTKILLVEKRYDGSEANPSVTAKWIEIPEGEEGMFLEKQLSIIDDSFTGTENHSNLITKTTSKTSSKSRNKLSVDDILAIISIVTFVIGFSIAVFVYRLKYHIG
jgi:hypothetical protein